MFLVPGYTDTFLNLSVFISLLFQIFSTTLSLKKIISKIMPFLGGFLDSPQESKKILIAVATGAAGACPFPLIIFKKNVHYQKTNIEKQP